MTLELGKKRDCSHNEISPLVCLFVAFVRCLSAFLVPSSASRPYSTVTF